jgi:hypothetical protein
MSIDVNYDRDALIKLKSSFIDGVNYYDKVENIIDRMYIYE